jgi:ubiquinone/menaquinone biosynthesis C-methylase UbiE
MRAEYHLTKYQCKCKFAFALEKKGALMPTETKQACYLRSERSATCIEFCTRVYGKMLNQFGTADMDQLKLMLKLLNLPPGAAVLDAGCGTGSTTKYLAECSGAKFTGLDISARAIDRGLEFAAGCPERLAFAVGTMDALDFPPASFEAVVAIESLYFAKDLTRTLHQFRMVLRSHGQMALFFTHIAEPGAGLGPDDTKLAGALRANHLSYRAHDLTESDRRFWERSKAAGEELRAAFEAEGNGDLSRLGESDALLDLVKHNRHARFLYHVPLP